MWNPYVSVSITLARLRTHTKFTRNAMDALTELEFKLVLFDVIFVGKILESKFKIKIRIDAEQN